MGKGDKNRESPTGKRAKKRTLRRMDNRNKASILNSRRKRNRRIIDMQHLILGRQAVHGDGMTGLVDGGLLQILPVL